MKSFTQYLESLQMDIPTAMSVFGLSSYDELDSDSLQKLYRKLAMKNHPDAGGEDTKFANIANAYEVLKGLVGKTGGETFPVGGQAGYAPDFSGWPHYASSATPADFYAALRRDEEERIRKMQKAAGNRRWHDPQASQYDDPIDDEEF